MAGAAGGTVGSPTPWWQLPGGGATLSNLTKSAPSGYEYDPVAMQYQRTPTSAGTRVNQFDTASLGGSIASLTGLASGASGTPGAATGGSTGVFGAGNPSGAVSAGAGVAAPQLADPTASNNAIFAAAKDKVGQLSRSSLDSLNGELGAQGMLGSGAQVQGARDVIQSGAGELGQVTRDLASKNADTANDFAKTAYEGNITMRGQDVQAQEAQARLALEARQQNFQLLNTILNGLRSGGGSPLTGITSAPAGSLSGTSLY